MKEKAYLSKLFVTSIIALVFLCFGFVITPAAAHDDGPGGLLRFLRIFFSHLVMRDLGNYEWTEVNPAAPWAPRAGLESVELGRRFYVMGGQSFSLECPIPGSECAPEDQVPVSVFYNDVYRSSDGIRWELMTDDAAWAPRSGLSAVCSKIRSSASDAFCCGPF